MAASPVSRDASLDLLKWLAMLAMVLDHLRFVLPHADALFIVGRFAFPFFCLALAANVARAEPGHIWTQANAKYIFWLAVFALVSELPHVALVGHSTSMNVMPTLLVGLLIAWGAHHPGVAPKIIAGCGMAFAAVFSQHLMYGFFGALMPAAMVLALNRQGAIGLLAATLALLSNIDGVLLAEAFGISGRAMIALAAFSAPIAGIWLLRYSVSFHVKPLTRWAYLFYPGHMAALALMKTLV